MISAEVYVVTLQFDSQTFAWLQKLRTLHFPSHRNFLPAHLTLLHTASLDQVNRLKQNWGKFERTTLPLIRFTGLQPLGRGTAVCVDSPSLEAIRSDMMQIMGGPFSRQDQQSFRPHVTVQNKVDEATARALLHQLSAQFVPRDGTGPGLMIWRYLGGPWSLDTILAFEKEMAR